jgi:hypothetical protein
MFFLLFGLRTRERAVSGRPAVCEVCGVLATQTLVKRSTMATLFFIPLFPVKPSSYYVVCAHCGTARRRDRESAGYDVARG